MKKLLIIIYLLGFGFSLYGNETMTDNDSLRVVKLHKYLEEATQPADEYVLEKLRDFSIVAIGEDHWNHQQILIFNSSLSGVNLD